MKRRSFLKMAAAAVGLAVTPILFEEQHGCFDGEGILWKTETFPDGHTYGSQADLFIPELWARESLAILQENMAISQLVHRDFTDEIQNQDSRVTLDMVPGEFVFDPEMKTVMLD